MYRATIIPQITCLWRSGWPFTLHLLVSGTTRLTHPISASGRHQMFLNNFSYRLKFFPFCSWTSTCSAFLPVQTRQDTCTRFLLRYFWLWNLRCSEGRWKSRVWGGGSLESRFSTRFICPTLKRRLTRSWKVSVSNASQCPKSRWLSSRATILSLNRWIIHAYLSVIQWIR